MLQHTRVVVERWPPAASLRVGGPSLGHENWCIHRISPKEATSTANCIDSRDPTAPLLCSSSQLAHDKEAVHDNVNDVNFAPTKRSDGSLSLRQPN
jgi:hypothetical protein